MRLKAIDPVPVEQDIPFRGRVYAGNQVEDRGFSCSVRPDQPPDLTESDLQVVVLNGAQASEVVSHVVDPKELHVRPSRPDFVSVGGGS